MTGRIGVVVVSADEGTRSQVRLTLGDARFDVRDVTDVAGAMGAVAEHRPAVVVLDLGLPDQAALGVARSLRAEPETAGIRTLVLVPRGSDPPEVAEVDATIRVPATPFSLLRKVEELSGS